MAAITASKTLASRDFGSFLRRLRLVQKEIQHHHLELRMEMGLGFLDQEER